MAPALNVAPGRAYFAIAGSPMVVLEPDGSFRELSDTHFRTDRVGRLVTARDGNVYAAVPYQGIARIDARGITTVVEGHGSDRFAVTSRGVVWILEAGKLKRADGDAIEEIDPEVALGRKVSGFSGDIAVDLADRLWVVSGDELFVGDGSEWTKVHLHPGTLFFPGRWSLATHPGWDGVYAACDTAITRVAGDGRPFPVGRLEPAPDSLRGLSLAFSSASAGIAHREDGRVFILPFESDELHTEPFDAPGLVLDAAAVDDQARAWLATPSALTIVDLADPTGAIRWPQGAIPALTGRIQAMAITGGGPSLPALKPSPKVAVRVTVLDEAGEQDTLAESIAAQGETPLRGAHVELCRATHDNAVAQTPCAGSPSKVVARTSAKGELAVELLPGAYEVGVEVDGAWYLTTLEVPRQPTAQLEPIDLTHAGWWLPRPGG